MSQTPAPQPSASSTSESSAPAQAVAVRPPSPRSRVDAWALALASQGVSSRILATPSGFVLVVAPTTVSRALAILDAYDRENPEVLESDEAPAQDGPQRPWAVGLAFAAAIAVAFVVTGSADSPSPAFLQGRSSAAAILAGEWWRTITALTLHVDLGHVMSNAIAGGFIVALLAWEAGYGGAVWATVISGALGNWLNAVVHGGSHLSVGASTAVFGAVGVLAGMRVAGSQSEGRPDWIPIAAGVAMVALMGASPDTDVLAHLLGFAAGLPVGYVMGRWRSTIEDVGIQIALGTAGVGLVVAAWWVAI